jgi:two-component system phosphate regulon sensor histidine kinase PhoR
MKNKAIRNIAILGSIAIAGIISVQIYWINQALYLQETRFQERVFLSLKNVAKNISDYNKMDFPEANPVKQISSNYYIVNIREIIDANILKLYLQKEFSKAGIQADYEYAIYDCSSEKMVYGEFVSFRKNKASIKMGVLPKYDDFVYYFGVNFPSKASYLIAGNKLWVFFSFLLLLTVLFFVYSLNVILRQKKLSELQKDFINNMAHEFKTPISTIHIAADALIQNKGIKKNADLKNYSQIIKEQNKRLNLQVEKVLQIADLERGKVDMKREDVSLHQIIKSVINSVDIKIIKKEGKVIENLNSSNDLLRCDKVHVTNILYNLIDNSIKYSNQAPIISISTKDVEGFLYLTIKDNGIGIPFEYVDEIKKKFFRVPKGKIHNVKGFGLGLFYVDEVAKAHSWQFTISSTPGVGTSIQFKMKN